jgi:hypothetical protein
MRNPATAIRKCRDPEKMKIFLEEVKGNALLATMRAFYFCLMRDGLLNLSRAVNDHVIGVMTGSKLKRKEESKKQKGKA